MSDQTSPAPIELSRIVTGRPHAPVVYFVRIGRNVKIGTTRNLMPRMRGLYLSLEQVLVIVPGGRDVEAAYHERFAANRIEGEDRRELFRFDGQLRLFLVAQHQRPPSTPDSPGLMTLRQACEEGVLRIGSVDPLGAARKAAQRPGFPEPAGWGEDGRSALYLTAGLAEWQRARERKAS